MKFAGYNLISSFTPTHSVIVKSPCRFPLRNFSGNSAKLRNISAYIPRHQLHAKAPKVAADCYFPPLFRLLSIFFYPYDLYVEYVGSTMLD